MTKVMYALFYVTSNLNGTLMIEAELCRYGVFCIGSVHYGEMGVHAKGFVRYMRACILYTS
jgi:hypothetical protein